ncbi:cell division protein FtsQ/DivIB [Pectinatus frisingensis]|uniref:cell division protein FtsQ/DivIB n=1 Tax=Pectinatus frisingensis TaxID=865 RepID=UPI0018C803FE|nr:FtsQ-type POTRA domain-containing protein [Pectinatus frisingensis]
MKKNIFKRYIGKSILLLLCITVIIILLRSPLLAVGHISVSGNETLNKDEICSIAGIKDPVNIFAISTDNLQNRLENDLRIEKATVRRNFPNTALSIEIRERHPVATLQCSYGYVDIAQNDIIIHAYKNLHTVKIPLLTGTVLPDVYIGDIVTDETITKTVHYLSGLDNDTLAQIAELNIADPQNIIAYTSGGVKIKLGDLSLLEQGIKETTVFLHDLNGMNRPVDYVDFSYGAPVLKFKP